MPKPNRDVKTEMWKLARRMNQLMDEWMHAGFSSNIEAAWQPAVDVMECHSCVCILAEVAGMTAEDIAVKIEGDTVILSGQRALKAVDAQMGIFQMELARGAFRRTLRLPFRLAADQAEITCEQGLLEIKVPKVDAACE